MIIRIANIEKREMLIANPIKQIYIHRNLYSLYERDPLGHMFQPSILKPWSMVLSTCNYFKFIVFFSNDGHIWCVNNVRMTWNWIHWVAYSVRSLFELKFVWLWLILRKLWAIFWSDVGGLRIYKHFSPLFVFVMLGIKLATI